MDLTEAEDIRGGKNTQTNYTKKIFMTQIITMVKVLPESKNPFPGGLVVKNLPAKQKTQVQSLGREDPLE